ncbi:hypothetical protein [Trichloromonas sp.]|uniref:hypothetical protein n=1 Tax=Trichloromonas sp. TaxID=3069249 RepID=UPI002A46D6D0|nr:hypothetical protein [Trichloromonas sp.]
MNAKLGQHMILLGLCAVIFYAVMLVSGKLPLEAMPQFIVSAVIFMSSGHFMRKAARNMAREEDEKDDEAKKKHKDLDWPWLTTLLNWTAAFLIIGIMAIILMKPIGVTFHDALRAIIALDQQYFSHSIP